MHIDKLDDVLSKQNNKYYSKIQMKHPPKSSNYADFDEVNNDQDPKCKVVDHVKMSKYQKYFCKNVGWKLAWTIFWD